MDNNNNHNAKVTLMIDRERHWQMDLEAFERVCDGFDELGMTEFAENPVASIQALGSEIKEGNKRLVINRRTSKILRVWLWAGLTSEDPELKLSDVSRSIPFGQLPLLAIKILPAISEAMSGPPEATAEPENAVAVTGPSDESVSG